MSARPAVPATGLDRRTIREEIAVVLALSLLASGASRIEMTA